MVDATPSPPALRRVPQGLGLAGLVAAFALVVLLPNELDTASNWWTAWLVSSAVLVFAFPLTMLALWRNADHRPVLDERGRPRGDARGRPLRRRVERPGSRALLAALALQSAGLLVLIGALVVGTLRG